jgi:hypothetical protein
MRERIVDRANVGLDDVDFSPDFKDSQNLLHGEDFSFTLGRLFRSLQKRSGPDSNRCRRAIEVAIPTAY